MTPTLDDLRAEFPPAARAFAAKHSPAAVKRADAYNRARLKIDPDDPQTIALARRRLASLREMFPNEPTPTERNEA